MLLKKKQIQIIDNDRVSAARDGRGHLKLVKRRPLFIRARLEVGCKRIVRVYLFYPSFFHVI